MLWSNMYSADSPRLTIHLPMFLCLAVGRGMIAGAELVAAAAPPGLLVDRGLGEAAQSADHAAVDPDGVGGQFGAGRLVHEGHELVGEAGHGAADTDAAHV